MKIEGRVWKFGDDINTDYILPGEYLELIDPEEMAHHVMEGLDPKFSKKVKKGDIITAGENFGCGSSREHAPLALKYSGVGCILAENFARIFYRNAINIGLPSLICPGITDLVEENHIVKVNVTKGWVKNIITGQTIRTVPLPTFMVEILNVGGLTKFLKNNNGW